MGKLKVGVLYGGKSVEHDISLLSAKNILQNIDRTRFDIYLLAIDKDGKWYLCTDIEEPIKHGKPLSLMLDAKSPYFYTEEDQIRPAVIFPVLHGTDGEDGSVQGLMQTIGLPYVGSGVLGSAASMDKLLAKRVLQSANLPVAIFKAFHHHQKDSIVFQDCVSTLGLPFIVKPANLGSSVGVAKVAGKKDFQTAIDNAFRYDQTILLEEFIDGREVECAVLGNKDPLASVAGEVVVSGKYDFYSFTAKYEDPDSAQITIPADMPDSIHEKIKTLSLQAYNLLNCHDLARVDLFVKADGSVFINEINTLPGFTNISMYPSLIQYEGIGYQALITNLIEMAIDRYEERGRITTDYESQL
jgi:D-alanine-D-alanine ligase